MPIELKEILEKETRGMLTRARFKLSAEPDTLWLDVFAKGAPSPDWPREVFKFEKDGVACEFYGPRLEEVVGQLQLYIEEANRTSAELRLQRRNPSAARRKDEAARRQTKTILREIFDDDGKTDGGENGSGRES